MHIKDYHRYLSNLNIFNVLYDLRVLTGECANIIGETARRIFQPVMENTLVGLINTKYYLDVILVYGSTLKECYQNVVTVLKTLDQYNVRVNKNNCFFIQFHWSLDIFFWLSIY